MLRRYSLNRTQTLVLGFLLVAWISLAAILAVAPEVYDQALQLSPDDRRFAELAFLAAISAVIALLMAGVVRRWRWTFWLILVAFLAGVLRVPVFLLELAGVLHPVGPVWFMGFRALLGLVSFAIGLAMLTGYRRGGVWAAL